MEGKSSSYQDRSQGNTRYKEPKLEVKKHSSFHPNRPVDFTVAQKLHCGDRLHKDPCKYSDHFYAKDEKHVPYLVSYVNVDKVQQSFTLYLVNEFSMEPIHPTMEEALHYHRVEDCACRQRRAGNNKTHKPGSHQQIVLGKGKS